MYKAFKNLSLLFLLVVLCLINCEGRRTNNQALKQDINDFKKDISFDNITYVPETYSEHIIDTSFNNGLSVKLKLYTDMTSSVLHTLIKDTINHQTHFRNYAFEVTLVKNNKRIFNEVFNKERVIKEFNFNGLSQINKGFRYFQEQAILHSASINHELSNNKTVTIDLLYKIPKKIQIAHFTLQIDDEGNANYSFVNIR